MSVKTHEHGEQHYGNQDSMASFVTIAMGWTIHGSILNGDKRSLSSQNRPD